MEMFRMVQFTDCQVASGFMYCPQITRFCGAIGEQIQHQQSTVAPALGKTDAPTNSWIVDILVSGRRIEANKRHRCQGFIPLPSESVAVEAVLRKRSGCFHGIQVLDYFTNPFCMLPHMASSIVQKPSAPLAGTGGTIMRFSSNLKA